MKEQLYAKERTEMPNSNCQNSDAAGKLAFDNDRKVATAYFIFKQK